MITYLIIGLISAYAFNNFELMTPNILLKHISISTFLFKSVTFITAILANSTNSLTLNFFWSTDFISYSIYFKAILSST